MFNRLLNTQTIPNEIWLYIFNIGVLNQRDLHSLSLVCVHFNTLIKNNIQKFKNIPLHRFKEDQATAFIQLQNGDFACQLESDEIQILDNKTGACKQKLIEHVKILNENEKTADESSEDEDYANPNIALYQHSSGLLLSIGKDHRCYVHDLTKKTSILLVEKANVFKELPNKDVIISQGNNLQVWDLKNKALKEKITDEQDNLPTALAIDKEGNLVMGDCKGTLWFFNTNFEITRYFQAHSDQGAINTINFLEDGYITSSTDGTVCVWDKVWDWTEAEHIKPKPVFRHPESVKTICVIAENKIVIGSDQNLRVWNIETGQCEHTFEGHTSPVISAILIGPNHLASISKNELRIENISSLIPKKEDALISRYRP